MQIGNCLTRTILERIRHRDQALQLAIHGHQHGGLGFRLQAFDRFQKPGFIENLDFSLSHHPQIANQHFMTIYARRNALAGESLEQAALRESMEEANAELDNLRLYTVISLPHISQVYMMFLAVLKNIDFYPGEESLETRLFREQDIPWHELAFKTIHSTLESFFEDQKQGIYPLHSSTIDNRNH